ncbi:MAG TPA: L,D-transpeptidase family protein [Croceibacterium sp.]|nr:L,D-transpeptidase family protein [Croceibacterium sp.]
MGTPVTERMLRSILPALAAALLAPLPQAAHAQGWETGGQRSFLQKEIADRASKELRPFYAARRFQPLWLNEFGRPSGAAAMLMHHLRTAQFDGLEPDRLRFERVARLVDKARRGDEEDIAKAEIALSTAFAGYVRGMRAADRSGMIYESAALAPVVPTVRSVLDTAAKTASLEDYVAEMRWMHPLYAPMREAMEDRRFSESQRRQIWTNLARIRAIPAIPQGRHVLVDTASATLWMYEDGRPVDSMRVVVGKPELQTPTMAGFIRYAIVNPYWNVPADLVQNTIAANVLARGVGYLKNGGYQVFADWREGAPPLDPHNVNWTAVREGRAKVHVRQLPGGSNFMGKVKFEFPNAQGIYLHDTPDKHLLREDARQFSSGCVRLEDAARMHRWLMGQPLPTRLRGDAEQTVPLPEMVPIYITYLTAMPQGQQIVFHDDPYGRDGLQLAAVDGARADRP